MRAEKKLLVQEASTYFSDSDYLYLADFTGVTVAAISELRKSLRAEGAECHVVKNSILKLALEECGCHVNDSCFAGHTAVISGGKNPSGVAKILFKFSDNNDKKMAVKSGVLSGNELQMQEIKALSELPSLDVLRAKMLALFNTPAQQLVRVLNAVPQGLLNVLQAKSQKES